MNKTTLKIFKQLKKKYKNIKLHDIVECICRDISKKTKEGVQMQELFERTERWWPGNILKDIERRCIHKTIRTPDKAEILKNFFEPFMKCPEEIKDCQKLREEFDKRLLTLKSNKKCSNCSITSLKLYFIDNFLIKNIKI